MRNALVFLATFLVVVGVIFGLYTVVQKPVAVAATSAGSTAQFPDHAPQTQLFTVTAMTIGEHHRWMPDTIVVRKGDKLRLNVVNGDPVNIHGLTVAALGLNTNDIKPGESKEVTITANEVGVFSFKCSKTECAPDHNEMAGQIVVLP
ncbi:MAG TPA: cupredoxin domain-containing protein [Symbiobacteriaceae bacterium]|nr:cupredoxin domain-containing protein [Symbiobacteriaceae bacterium]